MDLILYICYDIVTTDQVHQNSPTVQTYSVHMTVSLETMF